MRIRFGNFNPRSLIKTEHLGVLLLLCESGILIIVLIAVKTQIKANGTEKDVT